MELCFVMAPGQNQFFRELVDALADEFAQLGVRSSVATGAFPDAASDTVFVLLPAYEYLTLTGPAERPAPRQLERTIFVCAEQPNSKLFEHNLALANATGNPLFDINRTAVNEYRHRGIAAAHLQIGWTRGWARFDPHDEDPRDVRSRRPVDALHLGTRTPRRAEALAQAVPRLHGYECDFRFGCDAGPLTAEDPSWLGGSDRLDLFGRSRVLLNVHRDSEPYFEWLRVVQAIANGVVVVSEWSADAEPLVSGRHYLTAVADELGIVADYPLRFEEVRHRIACDAYDLLKNELPMRDAAQQLVGAAAGLVTQATSPPAARPAPRSKHDGRVAAVLARLPDERPTTIKRFDHVLRTIKQARADENATREAEAGHRERGESIRRSREQGDAAARKRRDELGHELGEVELLATSSAYDGARPKVTVVVSSFDYADLIAGTLTAVACSDRRDIELVVVDDCSTDDSRDVVSAWIFDHPRVPALLLGHVGNRGVGPARNTGAGAARGDYVFILDADNRVYPRGISRLLGVLEADPTASCAYGMLEMHAGDHGSVGLLSSYPWEPARFGDGNYIDAMMLWRRFALIDLGGFTADRSMHAWEDWEILCRLAQRGGHAVRTAQAVARYRTGGVSMSTEARLAQTIMYERMLEKYPELIDPGRPDAGVYQR